jgi:hypothetical protein
VEVGCPVRLCSGGAHAAMWEYMVKPYAGPGPTWLNVGPDPYFLFSICFVMIMLLLCDASLLSSLVPHG